MKYQEYLTEIQKMQADLLDFLDDESNDDKYQELITSLNSCGIQEKKEELELFLNFLATINAYHHRTTNFCDKIKQIIQYLKHKIQENFSSFEIFDIFKLDKKIILYFLNEKIITIDESILKAMDDFRNRKYYYLEFFQPEIQTFIQENNQSNGLSNYTKEIIEKEMPINFIENRNYGENDNYICQLIRDDNVIEFIIYVNKNNYPLNSVIKSSIYETHAYLLRSYETTLIEYSAYFGSIQIFQYLRMNNVQLTSSLWVYVIHSRNAELLHLLEENHIKPINISYYICLKESIKCHHNDFAYYIKNNLLTNEKKYKGIHNKIIVRSRTVNIFQPDEVAKERKRVKREIASRLFYSTNEASFGFHFYNFEFIPSDNSQIDLSEFSDCDEFKNTNYIFFYACQYGYFSIVKILFETEEIDSYGWIIL